MGFHRRRAGRGKLPVHFFMTLTIAIFLPKTLGSGQILKESKKKTDGREDENRNAKNRRHRGCFHSPLHAENDT